jgi:hypothetical protein
MTWSLHAIPGALRQVAEALAQGRTPPAVRLRTILKYALKLAGLALVGIGTSLPEASAALCCCLVAYDVFARAGCASPHAGIISHRYSKCFGRGCSTHLGG